MFCPLDFGTLHHFTWTAYIIIEYIFVGSFDGLSNIMFTAVLLLRLFVSGAIISDSYYEVLNILESILYTTAGFIAFNALSMLNFYIV
jgi:hypothetical protein